MFKSKLIQCGSTVLVSWVALAIATGACGGGGDSPSKDAGVTSDAGDAGLFPTTCMKQVVPGMAQPYILSDFSSSTDGKTVSWGYSSETAFSGYSFQYPDTIVSDMTGGSWHLTGTIGNYSGFAIGFSCAVDASAYTGISFSIKGDAGSTGRMVMSVGTSVDDVNKATAAPSWGKCVPKVSEYDGTCMSPHADVSVTTTTNTIKLKWADFKGGAPQPSVSADSISGMVWIWDWIAGATPFPVDITVDDLVFTVD